MIPLLIPAALGLIGGYLSKEPKKYHLGGDMSKHLAPNGKPSNLTHKQWHLVRTPEFKAWFGDWENDPKNASKVVDSNGEPLPVYHGTTQGGFNVFNMGKITDEEFDNIWNSNYRSGADATAFLGSHFAKEKSVAKKFTKNIYSHKGNNPKIYTCFLNIRNIKVTTEKKLQEELREQYLFDHWAWDRIFDYSDSIYGLESDEFEKKYKTNEKFRKQANEDILGEDHSDALSFANYMATQYMESLVKDKIDGVEYQNLVEGGTSFIVFNPNQIKLADGTNTTFDAENPDIRYAKGGFIDENGNNIVYSSKDYRISVDDTNDARIIMLWYNDGNKYKRVGKLLTEITEIRLIEEGDKEFQPYLKVSYIQIDKEHRSKGFGYEMYKQLIKYRNPKIKGIISYLPDRSNKTQIPKIWKKLGGRQVKDNEDMQIIRFDGGGYIGCDYFKSQTGMPYYDEIIMGHNKKAQYKIVNIRIDDYFKLIRDENGKSYSKEYHLSNLSMRKDKVAEIMIQMKKGVKYDMPVYDFTDGFQEGRHRLIASYNLGCKYVNVALFGNNIDNELIKLGIQYINNTDIEPYAKGGRTVAQTPAPKKDRVYGSNVNKPKSSSTTKSGKKIIFSGKTLNSIKEILEKHNSKYSSKKVPIATAKAVVRRGMGAYSSSHRPTISGGRPNSRVAWGLARLNAFVYKIQHGKSKSGKYVQDDDLIKELGYTVQNK
jgi:hypothetical protein